MSTEDLAAEWLEWHRDHAESALATYSKYAGVMIRWFDWCGVRGINPDAPTLEEMERFVNRPRRSGRVGKARTKEFDVKVLRGFYRWASDRGSLPRNLAADLRGPKIKSRNPRPIEPEHWATMWARNTLSPRLRVLLGMGYFAGLRVSELAALRANQLTPARIVNFTRKGGGEQTLPWADMARVARKYNPLLLPHMVTLTEAVTRTRRSTTWPTGLVSPYMDDKGLREWFTRLCQACGLPHYTPHQLRHSCATNLVNAGIPLHQVQALMNHADINTTMTYVKANPNDLSAFL